jgi:uncharacterized membrane protein YeaQ/YmgE (transglycosylase-associated protein family)
MSLANPIVTFLIILLIGIVAGLLMQRLRTSWIAAQISGRRGVVTSALVGIAGSFVGYHIGVILGLAGSGSAVLFVAAIIGAAVVLWVWKTLRV